MPVKILSSSSRAIALGCICPNLRLLAGSVTSIVSFSSLASSAVASRFSFALFMASSMISLVSLTSAPTFGLSSFATSFIPFKTSVSSPFFPVKATLTSFNASRAPASLIASKALSLICSRSSLLIAIFIYSLLL